MKNNTAMVMLAVFWGLLPGIVMAQSRPAREKFSELESRLEKQFADFDKQLAPIEERQQKRFAAFDEPPDKAPAADQSVPAAAPVATPQTPTGGTSPLQSAEVARRPRIKGVPACEAIAHVAARPDVQDVNAGQSALSTVARNSITPIAHLLGIALFAVLGVAISMWIYSLSGSDDKDGRNKAAMIGLAVGAVIAVFIFAQEKQELAPIPGEGRATMKCTQTTFWSEDTFAIKFWDGQWHAKDKDGKWHLFVKRHNEHEDDPNPYQQ